MQRKTLHKTTLSLCSIDFAPVIVLLSIFLFFFLFESLREQFKTVLLNNITLLYILLIFTPFYILIYITS